ncbi:hypothetical protein [Macrococcus animalis]|uniref:hypothetical protein n=1 Tax=Macrococcus animalis TaxID=3395467 RepID=UPI0039BDB677
MKPIFTFENNNDFNQYKDVIQYFHIELANYQKYLEDNFQLSKTPSGVFWTSRFVIENVLNKPVPAFTRDEAIYMCADLDYWESYLSNLLPEQFKNKYASFYKENTQNEVLAIFGHELTHHIDLFLAEFDDENPTCEDMWFEEGMATFLPRKFFFNDALFDEVYQLEKDLFDYYAQGYDDITLENFTYDIYSKNETYIMSHYWLSFIKVTDLVRFYEYDIKKIFDTYHQWDSKGRTEHLYEYLITNR